MYTFLKLFYLLIRGYLSIAPRDKEKDDAVGRFFFEIWTIIITNNY